MCFDSNNPNIAEPFPEHVEQAATKIIKESVKPLHNAEHRRKLVELQKTAEQIIDTISPDVVIEAGFSADALDKAKGLVTSFEQFIKDHKDETSTLLKEKGGIGKAYQLFGEGLWTLLDELNEVLAA